VISYGDVELVYLDTHDGPFVCDLLWHQGQNLMTEPEVLTYDNAVPYITASMAGTSSKAFGIWHKEERVGLITLLDIHRVHRSAYLGMLAVVPGSGVKTGYGAVKALLSYAFNRQNLNRVSAHTWSDNPDMGVLYKRCGAKHEGTERQQAYKNGKYIDRLIYSVLKEEYGT